MNRQRGFTLVELLITIAVATILMTVAVPSFVETVKNNRLTTNANALLGALAIARSEAVKEGQRATVCASDDQATCGGDDWTLGWIVWVDVDGNGVQAASELHQVGDASPSSMTLDATTYTIQFTAQGALVTGTDGSITLCDDRTGETGRVITLSNTGRANISEAACS